MQTILAIAIGLTLFTSVILLIRFRNMRLQGSDSVPLLTFMAILFTSGLDVGLIMFPLTEFPTYASEAPYQFTNPLAIEFGFWGFLVWGFYFLTTFYFCIVEPKLKLFQIPWMKLLNTLVIIVTCAFTGFLFLSYLPDYINGIRPILRYGLVAFVVLIAVLSSTDIRYVKWLSLGSTGLFFALIASLWTKSGMGVSGIANTGVQIGGYFGNIHKFITPITDYHAFYLFWWFAWSIMIGQFVARFVGGLKAWQLCLALLTLPSIPIAIWFTVLYYYHSNGITLTPFINGAMVTVGVIFVINSLDSLIRLYSENFDLTVGRLGRPKYIVLHSGLLYGLILLYQFTPFKIEWVGLVVIGIYAAIYALIFLRREQFKVAN